MFAGVYYGCEVCPINKNVARSLQYVVNSCFSKIFQTRSDDVTAECVDLLNKLSCALSYLLENKHCYNIT